MVRLPQDVAKFTKAGGSGEDLSMLRIQDTDLKPKIIPMPFQVTGVAIQPPIYTDVKYCDSNLFLRQLSGSRFGLQGTSCKATTTFDSSNRKYRRL
jgi:hypothetical protein